MAKKEIKKSRLGKGLDSLIPMLVEEEKKITEVKEEVKEVKKEDKNTLRISEIVANRKQPRKKFDDEALEELASSIKEVGIIQPIVVQKREGFYEIIAGERRWRAAQLAGLKEVPVVIKDYSEEEIMEIALIENIQRKDLNPIEEANAYKKLIEEYNLKQDELAQRISKSRTAITNTMRLLKLCDEVQDMLIDGEISNGHGRALLAIEDMQTQLDIAEKIIEKNLSVREVEKLVKDINEPVEKKKKVERADDFIYKNIESQMKEILGTKVKISRKNENKGKIEIEYYSPEELERIMKIINK